MSKTCLLLRVLSPDKRYGLMALIALSFISFTYTGIRAVVNIKLWSKVDIVN